MRTETFLRLLRIPSINFFPILIMKTCASKRRRTPLLSSITTWVWILGSAGKGAACDTAVSSYASSGISGAIAAVGGSVGVYGQKPDGSPWSITVRNHIPLRTEKRFWE